MAGIPDYVERKGSLFLRSNHMNYGRATLNSNWSHSSAKVTLPSNRKILSLAYELSSSKHLVKKVHKLTAHDEKMTSTLSRHQAREAEPKDYDISRDDERNLCTATYHRIGDITDGSLPKTTYQDHAEQTNLKNDFQEQEVRKPMITLSNIDSVKLERDLGTPERGFGAVLPRHHPEYNKFHLETTHRADYTPPDPDFKPVPECPPDFPDKSAAFRKCHSQFTDTADYRRPGRNTWQDESGVYANTLYKQQVMKPSNPIPESA